MFLGFPWVRFFLKHLKFLSEFYHLLNKGFDFKKHYITVVNSTDFGLQSVLSLNQSSVPLIRQTV